MILALSYVESEFNSTYQKKKVNLIVIVDRSCVWKLAYTS